jgi:hypothetical protein
LFIYGRAEAVALQRYEGWRSMSLGADSGFQTELPELLQIMRMGNAAQVQKFLARLEAVPRRVERSCPG